MGDGGGTACEKQRQKNGKKRRVLRSVCDGMAARDCIISDDLLIDRLNEVLSITVAVFILRLVRRRWLANWPL